MSIGNKPIRKTKMIVSKMGPQTGYPYNEEVEYGGLTYREWLIGQAISNPKLLSCNIPLDESITMIIDSVNAIISKLDKEVKE